MRAVLVVLLVVLVLAAGGVALWLTGKLPFAASGVLSPPFETGDAQAPRDAQPPGDAQPAGDASAKAVRRQAGPLSSAQLGAPLVNGAWVTACGAPDTMKVVVKLDVRQGRAVKIDVKTDPTDPVVIGCVERAASDLRWDISPKTDHVTVRY
jgi:hypothetical protein